MERGGFDAIVGNPPYTRVQVMRQVRPDEADAYVRKYDAASEGSFDIAGLFIERCLPFLRRSSQGSGRLGMIISRQFSEADYGAPLRRQLASGRHVEEIVDFGAGAVFEGVGAYTLILMLNASPQPTFRLTRVPAPPSPEALGKAKSQEITSAVLKADTLGEETWDLLLPNESSMLNHLAERRRNLRDVSLDRIFQGVVTGADNTVFRFIDEGASRDHSNCRLVRLRGAPEGEPLLIESALLRPVFEGRSAIGRFIARESGQLLLLPYGRPSADDRYELLTPEVLSSRYPFAWNWLSAQKSILTARSGKWSDRNWYAFSARKNLELFERDKILVPYMVDHLCAHWDKERHFFVNVATGGYGIVPDEDVDPLYLTALLNSRVLSWSLRSHSRAWRGGWFAARKGNLVRLAIAEPDPEEQSIVIASYQQCAALRLQMEAAVSQHEMELSRRLYQAAIERFDTAVEDLYHLTVEERRALSEP